uniref:RNA-directed DNA polymerase, eukaryota, reverse transcriptase zinc-binding domain protein n=1 Tax=Tanacetum cinerariifolium TaxID=118510 RepID=A0A6L2JJI1_TANCI|nr:hypothetical protein [Tanacetum cinerariifolium]
MANLEFHDDFIGANALFQPYRISDHSPAILKIPTRVKFRPKPFKFSNLLVLNENSKSNVSCAWDMAVDGYDMFRVVKKLKALKKPLRNILKEKVSNEEIKEAIFYVGDDKSPGLDGYTVAFFKGAWDIVGVDVSKAIKEFFMSGKLLKEVNHTIIALILKVPSPTRVNDYRLISCCNVLFKCIRKIISNSIKDSLTDLVSINQSAFVPEEFIFHHHCSSLDIINLCFANDLFLFPHSDVKLAWVIMDALDEFKNVSGLVSSHPKSTTYFCNVLNHTKLAILNVLSFKEGTLPIKYLGVPLISTRLAYRDCKELVEKVQNRINNWKNKFLSFDGRLQLIQSVIASMHAYWSSVFILPSHIMSDIEQLVRSFLWCNGEMHRGKAKVAWEDICLPKDEGGLGIRRLDHFNMSLISSHDYPFRGNMTWGWPKILQILPIIRKFIWYKIGNGSSIMAWFDHWSMHSPIIQFITPRDIHAASFSMQTTVADVVSQNAWTWPLEWAHRYPLIFAITVLSLNEDNDQVVWKYKLDITKPFSVGTVWDGIRHHGMDVCCLVSILYPSPRLSSLVSYSKKAEDSRSSTTMGCYSLN